MKQKENNSIISLLEYKKEKTLLEKSKKASFTKTNSSLKDSSDFKENKIFYMSNYLKSKKIPDLKNLQEQKNPTEPPLYKSKEEKLNNLIILDDYRKKKRRIWKKQYTQEALSVSGLAFLFLFIFNLTVSIPSNSPVESFNTGHPALAREDTTKENAPTKISRGIAREKNTKKNPALTNEHWLKNLKETKKENVILGKKPNSSDYTGF